MKVTIKIQDKDNLKVFWGLSKMALENSKAKTETEIAFNLIVLGIFEKLNEKMWSDNSRFTLKLKDYEALVFKEMLLLTKETPQLTEWGLRKVMETIHLITKEVSSRYPIFLEIKKSCN